MPSSIFRFAALPVLLLAALLPACGGDDSSDGGGGTDAGADAGVDGGPDASGCTGGEGWVTQQVTTTPASGTYDGKLAVTASGQTWMAYAEPVTDVSSDQDIFTTQLEDDGCGWSTPEVRHGISTHQFAFPNLLADGDTLYAAFSGLFDATTQNNDVYFAKKEAGGAWTSATPLTDIAAGKALGAYSPMLALAADGDLAVAYLYAGDTVPKDEEVRVAGIVGSALTGDVAAITGIAGGCVDPQLAIDGTGVRHVLAACGPAAAQKLYYTNDMGGTFASPAEVGAAASTSTLSPSLYLDADDATLHLAFRRDSNCGSGKTCSRIFYAKRSGGTWSEPAPIDADATNDIYPVIAVTPTGTIYVAFERDPSTSNSDIYVATSTDGAAFDETLVTVGTAKQHDVSPVSLILHPTTGLPQFTYVVLYPGVPYNAEVWRAELK